jgi:hypothetical protein
MANMEINMEFYNWARDGYGHTAEGLWYKHYNPDEDDHLKWYTIRELFAVFNRRNEEKLENLIYETEQRVRWYVSGIGQHGLTPDQMFNLTTDRLCEVYNVDVKFFKR